jgi:excisionase family DNA binding protein
MATRSRGALLDIRDAAEYLGTSERHLRRLVTDKRIPYHKLGAHSNAKLRFDTGDLEAWLADNRFEPN